MLLDSGSDWWLLSTSEWTNKKWVSKQVHFEKSKLMEGWRKALLALLSLPLFHS